MQCGSCGAKIADKAIVCYRCGQATAIPAAARPPRRTPVAAARPWAAIVVLLVLAAAVGWFLRGEAVSPAIRSLGYVVAAAFLGLAVFFTLRRPGPRP